MMKRLHWLAILMGIVILAIAGFQVYWLKDNYHREQKAVEARSQSLFRETVLEVQDAALQKKITRLFKDSSGVIRIKTGTAEMPDRIIPPPPGAGRVLRLLNQKLVSDSANGKKGVIVSIDKDELVRKEMKSSRQPADSGIAGSIDRVLVVTTDSIGDSTRPKPNAVTKRDFTFTEVADGETNLERASRISSVFFGTDKGERFKIRFDTLLNDSVSLDELTVAFSGKMNANRLPLPFHITRVQPDTMHAADFIRRTAPPEVFAGYRLQLGNSISFLLKRISWPIAFSVVLVGLTIFSFVLLYRSLLRQHRLTQMKNDLISNITHELKTPIATVGVAIEALKNFNAMQDPQKTKEYLDISQNELQRLGLLVDKVLKLSMFENREMEIKYELFDLEDVVNEVVASLRLQLEKHDARIRVSAEGNLLLNGDRMHLLSVVYNLLDNALKYSRANATIRVNIREENENIILSVADNGVGIPQQYREKVFEKFFRVPSGDTHNAKGHGLGLSYVARVVQQHRGNIRLESQEGAGSTFTVVLPRAIG